MQRKPAQNEEEGSHRQKTPPPPPPLRPNLPPGVSMSWPGQSPPRNGAGASDTMKNNGPAAPAAAMKTFPPAISISKPSSTSSTESGAGSPNAGPKLNRLSGILISAPNGSEATGVAQTAAAPAPSTQTRNLHLDRLSALGLSVSGGNGNGSTGKESIKI